MSSDLEGYIEKVARHFEDEGMPRIAGRILAYLLVCDPPHASVTQLSDALGVSMGSASTMTRMLLGIGLIEKVAVPGTRKTLFRVTADGFERMFDQQLQRLVAFRALADEGLGLLDDGPPERTRALAKMRALYAFHEREMPLLLARWRAERAAEEGSSES
jgi:DNA-binding MarR family transcriptional regulator